MSRFNKKCISFRDQSGVSLVFALMTLLVLSILGMAIATVSFANLRLTATDRNYQSTYYIAEAGVNQAYAEAKDIVMTTYDEQDEEDDFYSIIEHVLFNEISGSTYQNFEENFGNQPETKIKIEKLESGNPQNYLIMSVGTIGNQMRSVEKQFAVNWTPKGGAGGVLPSLPGGMAAMILSKLDIKTNLSGNVYINSGLRGAVEIDWGGGVRNGSLYVPAVHDDNLIQAPGSFNAYPNIELFDGPMDDQIFKNLVKEFPRFPEDLSVASNISLHNNRSLTKVLTEDTFISEIKVEGGTTLTIDTKGSDAHLVVDRLIIPQGRLNVIGNGTLTIYINEKIEFGGSTMINQNGTSDELQLIYRGTQPITFTQGIQVNGSIFNKSANITFSGGQSFMGYVVSQSGDITLTGGSNATGYFIAPHSTITLDGGARLKGQVIVKNLTTLNGGVFEYQKLMLPEFPFEGVDTEGNGNEDLITAYPNKG